MQSTKKTVLTFSAIAIIALIIPYGIFYFTQQNNLLKSLFIIWLIFTLITMASALVISYTTNKGKQANGNLVFGTIVGKIILYLIFIIFWKLTTESLHILLLEVVLFFYVIYSAFFIRFAIKQLSWEVEKNKLSDGN